MCRRLVSTWMILPSWAHHQLFGLNFCMRRVKHDHLHYLTQFIEVNTGTYIYYLYNCFSGHFLTLTPSSAWVHREVWTDLQLPLPGPTAGWPHEAAPPHRQVRSRLRGATHPKLGRGIMRCWGVGTDRQVDSLGCNASLVSCPSSSPLLDSVQVLCLIYLVIHLFILAWHSVWAEWEFCVVLLPCVLWVPLVTFHSDYKLPSAVKVIRKRI